MIKHLAIEPIGVSVILIGILIALFLAWGKKLTAKSRELRELELDVNAIREEEERKTEEYNTNMNELVLEFRKFERKKKEKDEKIMEIFEKYEKYKNGFEEILAENRDMEKFVRKAYSKNPAKTAKILHRIREKIERIKKETEND